MLAGFASEKTQPLSLPLADLPLIYGMKSSRVSHFQEVMGIFRDTVLCETLPCRVRRFSIPIGIEAARTALSHFQPLPPSGSRTETPFQKAFLWSFPALTFSVSSSSIICLILLLVHPP